jgi:hypothetical protein
MKGHVTSSDSAGRQFMKLLILLSTFLLYFEIDFYIVIVTIVIRNASNNNNNNYYYYYFKIFNQNMKDSYTKTRGMNHNSVNHSKNFPFR